MIEVTDISSMYQEILNNNQLGYTFLIYSDFGDLKDGITNNEADTKITGVVSFLPSTLYGTGAKILNINTRLTLYINGIHKNKGDFVQQDEDIKQILNSMISAYNGLSQVLTIDETNYNMVMSFGLPQNLEVINLGPLARCLPVELYITLSAVVNGVSSKDKKFYLNKQLLEVLNANTTRVRNSETNSKEDKNATNTSELTNGINFRLTVPFLDEEPYNFIYDDLMVGRGNEALLLEVNKKDRWDNYVVVFGENADSQQDTLNIGFTFNLVEGDDDVITFDESWTQEYFETTDINGTTYNVIGVKVNNTSEDYIVVFWGDNSNEKIAVGESVEHIYTDELSGHNVIIYGSATLIPIIGGFDLSEAQDNSIVAYLYENDLDNPNWPYEASLTLKVIGNGDIKDYSSYFERPFSDYMHSITELILDDNITHIGERSFGGLQLKSITIPNNCISIGERAFVSAGSRIDFEGIDFGANEVLTTIGDYAFKQDIGITLDNGFDLTLPNSLETIGVEAFYGLINQTTLEGNIITIGENISSIGVNAFYYNRVAEIIINATTPPIIDDTSFGYRELTLKFIPYTLMLTSDCIISVPSANVDDYKSAYTIYADYIFAIGE